MFLIDKYDPLRASVLYHFFMFSDSHKIDEKFVSSACWIQGVYVFKELQDKQEMVAYYGLPKRMSDDGLYGNRYFCSIEEEDKYKMLSNRKCVAMKKTFYLQVRLYFSFTLFFIETFL